MSKRKKHFPPYISYKAALYILTQEVETLEELLTNERIACYYGEGKLIIVTLSKAVALKVTEKDAESNIKGV